jgi:hypothetical protein
MAKAVGVSVCNMRPVGAWATTPRGLVLLILFAFQVRVPASGPPRRLPLASGADASSPEWAQKNALRLSPLHTPFDEVCDVVPGAGGSAVRPAYRGGQ